MVLLCSIVGYIPSILCMISAGNEDLVFNIRHPYIK